MRAWKVLLPVVMFAAGAWAQAADLPTAEEVLGKMTKALAEMTTFEADLRGTSDSPDEGTRQTTAHVAMAKSEKEGRTIERVCLTAKRTRKDRDQKVTNTEGRVVNDGTCVWQEERAEGTKEIRVEKSDAQAPRGLRLSEEMNRDMTRTWKQYDLKTIGEETIDGRKTFVLEGRNTPEGGRPESTMRIWVSQDDFLLRRTVLTLRPSAEGPTWVTAVEYLNVRVNQPVDPAQFIYTPPEGATVVDRTQPQK